MPGRSVVDAAAWARSNDEARLIIAASFQQHLVSAPDIAAVLDRRRAVRRRLLIIETVRDCAAGSHSVGELSLVGLCRRARLPLPTRQLRRRDATGSIRYLDACFDDWKLVVEIDGAHHADVGQMWDDSARQNDLLLAGYVVLRYPVFVMRTQPQRVAREIRAALIAAGWRP
jgi:very-short-patch-repair endonuclease